MVLNSITLRDSSAVRFEDSNFATNVFGRLVTLSKEGFCRLYLSNKQKLRTSNNRTLERIRRASARPGARAPRAGPRFEDSIGGIQKGKKKNRSRVNTTTGRDSEAAR